MISGKAEGLASQAPFGNKQVSRNGAGAFYVYHYYPPLEQNDRKTRDD